MVRVINKNIITGELVARDLPVTKEQLAAWEGGGLAQEVFPHLSVADREWLVTGLDEAAWAEALGDEEEA